MGRIFTYMIEKITHTLGLVLDLPRLFENNFDSGSRIWRDDIFEKNV